MNKPDPKQPAPTGRPAASPGSAEVAVPDVGAEPTAQRAPFPALLLALLAGLVYWGSMYILEFGGDADARVYYPYHNFKEVQGLLPPNEEAALQAKGLLVYNKICVQCHQGDGNGSASQNAPPLAKSEWVQAKDPSRIIRIVLHGLSGPIKVLDKEWGTGQMLAWKDALSDEEIAMVLTYVRSSWGNKAPAVTPAQAKKVREESKDQPGYMTVPDLLKVNLKE